MVSWQWCLSPSIRASKIVPRCSHSLLPDSSSFLQRVAVFISKCVKTEHRLLGTPGAKTKPALRQGVVFFRLCPREVTYFCFSFCNSFSCEACNNLGQTMKNRCTRRTTDRSIFQQVPTLRSSASAYPGLHILLLRELIPHFWNPFDLIPTPATRTASYSCFIDQLWCSESSRSFHLPLLLRFFFTTQ